MRDEAYTQPMEQYLQARQCNKLLQVITSGIKRPLALSEASVTPVSSNHIAGEAPQTAPVNTNRRNQGWLSKLFRRNR